MSLNIKNEEVHAAVRELAQVLGMSQTSAVEVAVRAKLAELDVERQRAERERRIRQAVADCSRRSSTMDRPLADHGRPLRPRDGPSPMIIDASAIVAIAPSRADSRGCSPRSSQPPRCASCRRRPTSRPESSSIRAGTPSRGVGLDELIADNGIEVVAFTAEQAKIARQAYRDYGRGSGHPANLNFGDCFSYALAAERREPLLFVGDDFGHTDIRSAV